MSLETQVQLTETEKNILALSLLGYVMRAGPGQFASTIEIANKIGITKELESYAKDWIATSKETKPTPHTVNTSAQATIKVAIFNCIATQWHQKENPNFAEILKNSIYKELFESIRYNWALLEIAEKEGVGR